MADLRVRRESVQTGPSCQSGKTHSFFQFTRWTIRKLNYRHCSVTPCCQRSATATGQAPRKWPFSLAVPSPRTASSTTFVLNSPLKTLVSSHPSHPRFIANGHLQSPSENGVNYALKSLPCFLYIAGIAS